MSHVKCKENKRTQEGFSFITGKDGGDERLALSSITLRLDEASDPPKYDNVPADREELVLDVFFSSSSSHSLFPFELPLCISELLLLCEHTNR